VEDPTISSARPGIPLAIPLWPRRQATSLTFAVGFGRPLPLSWPERRSRCGAYQQQGQPYVNNVAVKTIFVGLSSAGLYQINLIVPYGLGQETFPFRLASPAFKPSGRVVFAAVPVAVGALPGSGPDRERSRVRIGWRSRFRDSRWSRRGTGGGAGGGTGGGTGGGAGGGTGGGAGADRAAEQTVEEEADQPADRAAEQGPHCFEAGAYEPGCDLRQPRVIMNLFGRVVSWSPRECCG